MDKKLFTINDQSGMIGDFLIAVATLVAVGFAGYMIYDANRPPANARQEQNQSTTVSHEDKINYPEAYKQYSLPEYPEAKVVTADQTDETTKIVLETTDDITKAGEFYEKAFGALREWTYTPPITSSKSLYGARATKNDEHLVYELTITKFSGVTNILIELRQGTDSAE